MILPRTTFLKTYALPIAACRTSVSRNSKDVVQSFGRTVSTSYSEWSRAGSIFVKPSTRFS
jgi:hypothetical protein